MYVNIYKIYIYLYSLYIHVRNWSTLKKTMMTESLMPL